MLHWVGSARRFSAFEEPVQESLRHQCASAHNLRELRRGEVWGGVHAHPKPLSVKSCRVILRTYYLTWGVGQALMTD